MKSGLGKGLSALLREEIVPVVNTEELVKIIDINDIVVSKYQPRKVFEYDKIKELADSISNSGLLQPIIVTKVNEKGKHEIIAGERRWRACRIAELSDIPVIIKDLNNHEILEIALVENIQREELSVIEEAEGFEQLIREFGYTIDHIVKMLGKSRSHITNILRLNQLPQSIKHKINEGHLSMGHARCLIGHEQAELIADHVIENDLNVRQTESLVKNWKKTQYIKNPTEDQKIKRVSLDKNDRENELKALAKSLSEKFGVKIIIESNSIGGKIIFHYDNFQQLDLILSKIS